MAEGRTPRQKPQRAAAPESGAPDNNAPGNSAPSSGAARRRRWRRQPAPPQPISSNSSRIIPAAQQTARPRPRPSRSSRSRSGGGGGGGGGSGYQQNFNNVDEEYDESKNGGGNGPLIDLNELKRKSAADLLALADTLGIQEGVARARKQDIVFLILKAHARAGGGIYGEGVLEILQDGFGFLRGPDESYLAGPDDIYVSPRQIRRFNLRTGDYITGQIRPPKEGERYFALLKVDTSTANRRRTSKNKILFENLTPLFPRKALPARSAATARPKTSPVASSI